MPRVPDGNTGRDLDLSLFVATPPEVRPEQYGAKGNGKRGYTGTTVATQFTFTDANASFTPADVGKCFTLGYGATGDDVFTTIAGYVSPTTVTLAAATPLTSTANVGYSYGTDDGPAFQAMFNDINNKVAPPNIALGMAVYYIRTPVTAPWNFTISELHMWGLGIASQIIVATNAGTSPGLYAFQISNMDTGCTFKDFTVSGTQGVTNDTNCPFYLNTVRQTTFQNVNFYATETIVAPPSDAHSFVYSSGCILTYNGALTVEDCKFRGCSAASGQGTSLVSALLFTDHVTVTDCQFLDYGYLEYPNQMTKTGITTSNAHVFVNGYATSTADPTAGFVSVERCFGDEGAVSMVSVTSNLAYYEIVPEVRITDCYQNGCAVSGAAPVRIQNTNKCLIDGLVVGWRATGNPLTNVIVLLQVTETVIRRSILTRTNIGQISADANCKLLVIEDTDYLTLSSSAKMTVVRQNGASTAWVKAGIPADTDFPVTPPDGTIVGDSTDSKIYIRLGGTWKGVAVA